MNKKLIGFMLAGFFMLSSSTNIFASSIIRESQKEMMLANGVTYKNVYTFTESGIQNVNLVYVDLDNPDIKLDLLFNKEGFHTTQKVSDMVKNDSLDPNNGDILAAINADFFSMSKPAFSLGPMVKDGKILSTPHYQINKYSTFLADKNKNVFFNYIKPDVSITDLTKNTQIPIAAINKPSKYYANIVMYTSEYYKNSPGANDTYYDLCEVVVVDDVITDIRYGQPPVAIPDNGYVLLAAGNNGLTLRDSFTVGDQLQLNSAFSLDYQNNIDLAVGGGSLILKDGELYPPTQKVSGKSQRSAIGVTYDNKLILFTTDGRLPNVIGMKEEDVANYMKSLGCKDAMLFDGGGSTELIVNDKIVNNLVGGAERRIVDSLAIKSMAQKDEFSSIQAFIDNDFGYVNDKFKLTVNTFDSDLDPLNIPIENMNFSVSGIEGTFNKNIFTPTSAGEGIIHVEYGNKDASIPVSIVGKSNTDPNLVDELGDKGINIAFLSDMNKTNTLLDNLIHAQYKEDIEKNADNLFLLSNSNTGFDQNLNKPHYNFNGSYSSQVVDNNLIVNLNSSNGGFFKSAGQWDFFRNSLNTTLDNVFIVLNSKESLKVKDEASEFKRSLHEASKNKNIYVIYRGNDFNQTVENNVRFISIPDYKDVYKDNLLNDCRYLLINIDGTDIKYTYKKVLL
ncbi:phosphodiester glycosidase family protein [Tepidibacter hydrothermalis]|uniref:Phosphodiester glycosidase family protein n=1 Tax=Tepidibacter hydrothermalis TaxID=3036126 RepID=A0ABY8EAV4_9FIRM|nr:phosphodiester glycosidase family protein [Tepidibacter hydrothermalis]WFD10052.1 phosphodiester glycosidase family protein [Tepidibacter hydrothermalis]